MANFPALKLLVLRFSSIGDILLITPVLRNLRRCLPGAIIHVATKAAYADLLRYNPHVDHLHLLEDGTEHQDKSDDLPGLIRTWRLWSPDAILDLHHNWRTARIKGAMLGTPRHVLQKQNARKWLQVRFKRHDLAVQHVVQRYLAAAAPLGVSDDGLGLEAHLPNGLIEQCMAKLPFGSREPYAALVLGAKHATKRMPESVLEKLVLGSPLPLVLLGGPDEQTLGEHLSGLRPKATMNTAGMGSLLESAAFLASAQRVIAPDTGMMHWAAAFGKPILSVWGNTTPNFGMYPYFGSTGGDPMSTYLAAGGMVSQVDKLACRPCSKLGYPTCPKGHFRCMEDQDSEAMLAWLRAPLPDHKAFEP